MARPSHSSGWRGRFATMPTRARPPRSLDDDQKGKPARLRLVLEPDHIVAYELGDGGVVRTESRPARWSGTRRIHSRRWQRRAGSTS